MTSQVYLWDAGTELNEEPFIGSNTVTNQADGQHRRRRHQQQGAQNRHGHGGLRFAYPAVSSLIKVTVTHTTGTLFDVTIDDLSTAALTTGDLVSHPSPLSPGVWALSSSSNALFTDQCQHLRTASRPWQKTASPQPWPRTSTRTRASPTPPRPASGCCTRTGTKPLFTSGAKDAGLGLEAIAEDGNAAALGTSLADSRRLPHGRRIQHARRGCDARPHLARLEVPVHVRR